MGYCVLRYFREGNEKVEITFGHEGKVRFEKIEEGGTSYARYAAMTEEKDYILAKEVGEAIKRYYGIVDVSPILSIPPPNLSTKRIVVDDEGREWEADYTPEGCR